MVIQFFQLQDFVSVMQRINEYLWVSRNFFPYLIKIVSFLDSNKQMEGLGGRFGWCNGVKKKQFFLEEFLNQYKGQKGMLANEIIYIQAQSFGGNLVKDGSYAALVRVVVRLGEWKKEGVFLISQILQNEGSVTLPFHSSIPRS